MFRSLLIALSLILLTIGGSGCSGSRIHQARAVLYEADSLRAAGVPYNDSLLLGETVNAFAPWHYLYPTDYARACYFYGRCLRAAGHQPQAMQSFINAIHAYDFPASLFTRQPDHAILARVYSNMANMCRLSENFELAVHMAEYAAREFLSGQDTLLYWYSKNDKAVIFAVGGNTNLALQIVSEIMDSCNDSDVQTKIVETQAIAYRHSNQYDSAIIYANTLQALGNHEPTGYMIKAQSFSYLGETDSALYYANYVYNISPELSHKYNALYILTHTDKTLNADDILVLTSARADLQMEYTKQQEGLAQATQLLVQDIARPYDWRWLYMAIAILAFMLTAFGIRYLAYRYLRFHRDTQLYSQNRMKTLEQACAILSHMPTDQLVQELNWHNYEQMCTIVNTRMVNIVGQLSKNKPPLSDKEIRLCILVLLNLSRKQMADMLVYAESGIGKLKHSTARKLGTTSKNMRTFLLQKVG